MIPIYINLFIIDKKPLFCLDCNLYFDILQSNIRRFISIKLRLRPIKKKKKQHTIGNPTTLCKSIDTKACALHQVNY